MEAGKPIWIGLVEVIEKPGCKVFQNGRGAFVRAMARARDDRDFIEKVRKALEDLDLLLVQTEEVKIFKDDADERLDLGDGVEAMLGDLQNTPGSVIFGSFHTWQVDDLSQ